MSKHSEAVIRSQRKHRERFNAYQREYWSRPENQEKRRLRSQRDQAWRKAKARDGRLNAEERTALEPLRQRLRYERWAERHRERLDYERAVHRDDRLTPQETAVRRKVYKYFQQLKWVARNPERAKQHKKAGTAAYYARRRGAPGHTSTDQLAARWAYYADRCWMCGAPATQTDHVIPLSRGGSNWPANLRPACGPCNREKWDRLPVAAAS